LLDQFFYGVCYYPEAWDSSRHASDISRIAAAGFQYVRMGEGAWSYWEPQEGKFQFDLFDRVIELCGKKKLKVILGTPTYTGPAWIATNYPEVLRWNYQRIPMKHGSRRNYNYTSPKYLELSDRIVTALAEHYRGAEEVFAWQLDNEFNCHMDVSYAPSDTLAFQVWLKRKYKTLDRLNAAWGTGFWSQTYDAWEQIDLPHPTPVFHNPSQLLDESRFISDTVVAFAERQAAILRRVNRRWLITHNGLFNNVNGEDLSSKLDFFSHDQYPLFTPDGQWPQYAMPLAQARSLSFPYGILEQQSGPGGQMQYLHRTPKVGEMRLWAWQSIAHGAKLLGYFRWRTCPYGTEQHWHGILDADDRDNRRLSEARQVGREIRALPDDFFDAEPVRSVAVLKDFDNEINDRRINTYINAKPFHGELDHWFDALVRHHTPTDIVWPGANLRGYRVLVAGHLKIVDRQMVQWLIGFVKAGGTLVLGSQSGSKDKNGHIVEQPAPGLLRTLAGVEVEEWSTLGEHQSRRASLASGVALELTTFIERLRPIRASVVAEWSDTDPLFNRGAAITVNRVGKGSVYYIGGHCPSGTVASLLGVLKLRSAVEASPDVEIIIRNGKSGRYTICLNHSGAQQRIRGAAGRDLLRRRSVDEGWMLEPYGVAIIVSPRKHG
jgi:beta-galactosidase